MAMRLSQLLWPTKFFLAVSIAMILLGVISIQPLAAQTTNYASSNIGDKWQNAKERGSNAWENVKEGSARAWENTKEGSSNAWSALKGNATQVWTDANAK